MGVGKGNADKIVGEAKFVDLSSGVNAPEEDEIKGRRVYYEKIKFKVASKMMDKRQLPLTRNKEVGEGVEEESLVRREPNLAELMEEGMKNLVEKLENKDGKLIPNFSLIYSFV